jgi:translation initiation factor IF-2
LGWKNQSHDISAKVGTGVKELLEKYCSGTFRFKIKSKQAAQGTVVEALGQRKGYVST